MSAFRAEHIAQPEHRVDGRTVIHPGLSKDCAQCQAATVESRPLRRGQRFAHMSWITPDSSPRRGRIRYEVCVITGTRRGVVYYTLASRWDQGLHRGLYYTTALQFRADVVREWVD
jgi:hypothetical protein